MMTPREQEEAAKAVADGMVADINRVLSENLRDPDLAATSPDFRAGYARGFREASMGFLTRQVEAMRRRLSILKPRVADDTPGCDCDQRGNSDAACHASDCNWRKGLAV